MEAELTTYILAGLGAITLTGALGLLAKHLTLDHQSIDRRLDAIIDFLEKEEIAHQEIQKELHELKHKLETGK